MFVVLWGSLLAAYALGLLFRDGMRREHLGLAVLVLGLAVSPYLSPHQAVEGDSVEKELANPDIGRGGANGVFLLSPTAMAHTCYPQHGVNRAEWHYGLIDGAQRLCFPCSAEVPAPAPGDLLHIDGSVPPEHRGPVKLTITLDDTVLAVSELAPGPFTLAVPVTTAFPNERVRLTLRTNRYLDPVTKVATPPSPGAVALQVTALRFEDKHPRPGARLLLSAAELQAVTRYGHPTVHLIHATRPCLAQLPVFFYPGVLEVRDNRRTVAYSNLGCWTAVELEPGDHRITVRFVGLRWANRLSLLAALAALASAAFLGVRALRRRIAAPMASEIALSRAA
jgi:hypothetical protein